MVNQKGGMVGIFDPHYTHNLVVKGGNKFARNVRKGEKYFKRWLKQKGGRHFDRGDTVISRETRRVSNQNGGRFRKKRLRKQKGGIHAKWFKLLNNIPKATNHLRIAKREQDKKMAKALKASGMRSFW